VEYTDWQQLDALARRLHSGDCHVYSDALLVCNPLAEIADLGSSFQFIPHSTRLLECRLKVNGIDAIPAEVKSLTAAGKLSVKPMPKARFHEIYQDYVCGCMLRVAREVFVLLPVDTLLITASADLFDSSTGKTGERPVVSAFLHRAVVSTLDFDRLDPSDAIDSFQHRGDFKATRKSGAFLPVAPLMPSDLIQNVTSTTHVADVLAQVKRLRMELTEECGELGPQQTSSIN
jgi:hypothetical protein